MKIAAPDEPAIPRRTQLTRERVVATAIEIADRDGIVAVSMRGLAQELGVEAMSLYTHVRNKDDLLDGMVDAVIGAIPLAVDGGWKSTLRRTMLAARGVMLRHPWAPRTIETRTAPGVAALGYVNAILGVLRDGGFSIAQAHHALHILGSRVLGFTREVFDDAAEPGQEPADGLGEEFRAAFPYAAEMAIAVSHGGALGPCDDDGEFEFALDFLLDGLDRLRRPPSGRRGAGKMSGRSYRSPE